MKTKHKGDITITHARTHARTHTYTSIWISDLSILSISILSGQNWSKFYFYFTYHILETLGSVHFKRD